MMMLQNCTSTRPSYSGGLTQQYVQPHDLALKQTAGLMVVTTSNQVMFHPFVLEAQSLVGMMEQLGPTGLRLGLMLYESVKQIPIPTFMESLEVKVQFQEVNNSKSKAQRASTKNGPQGFNQVCYDNDHASWN